MQQKPKMLPAKTNCGSSKNYAAKKHAGTTVAANMAYTATWERLGRAWQQKIDGGTRRLCVKHEMPWMERFEKEEAEEGMRMRRRMERVEDRMSGGAWS